MMGKLINIRVLSVRERASVRTEREEAVPAEGTCALSRALTQRISQKTRSSWLNCALRDDEAVYWVSIGHYEAVAVGN